jgi:hypothetical protein
MEGFYRRMIDPLGLDRRYQQRHCEERIYECTYVTYPIPTGGAIM